MLSAIAKKFGFSAPVEDVAITGITMNTSDCRDGDLFVAMPGAKTHGAEFIAKAISLGAVAMATDQQGLAIAKDVTAPVLLVENSQQQRQTGAAVESFRNEMVNANEISQRVLLEAASEKQTLKVIGN